VAKNGRILDVMMANKGSRFTVFGFNPEKNHCTGDEPAWEPVMQGDITQEKRSARNNEIMLRIHIC